jgi:hypothetical protein
MQPNQPLPALVFAPLAEMTKAQINAEYQVANENVQKWELALRGVDVYFRAEFRAEIRSEYLGRVKSWANRAADCYAAYRTAAA